MVAYGGPGQGGWSVLLSGWLELEHTGQPDSLTGTAIYLDMIGLLRIKKQRVPARGTRYLPLLQQVSVL